MLFFLSCASSLSGCLLAKHLSLILSSSMHLERIPLHYPPSFQLANDTNKQTPSKTSSLALRGQPPVFCRPHSLLLSLFSEGPSGRCAAPSACGAVGAILCHGHPGSVLLSSTHPTSPDCTQCPDLQGPGSPGGVATVEGSTQERTNEYNTVGHLGLQQAEAIQVSN